MFEQWNDCERTVVLYALLKRLSFPNLKFLQVAIEYNLTQSYHSHNKLSVLEDNANSIAFLNKLVNKYNSIIKTSNKNNSNGEKNDTNGSLTNNDSTTSFDNESANKSAEYGDLSIKYTKKEDIIQDLLIYLPLLKPGNEEAKKIYIQLLPVIVEDSIKHIIPVELVQQMLSYLLIHPAINNEDRK